MNSFNCKNCDGCSHKEDKTNQWCYMFLDKPEIIPCGQHDKYKKQRQINGRLIKKLFTEVLNEKQ